MELYHGSTRMVLEPDHTLGNPYKDFGPGFYVVDNLMAAKDFMVANCNRWERPLYSGAISKYRYNPDPALKVLKFDRIDRVWLDAVTAVRLRGLKLYAGYDIVAGPCPDEAVCSLLGRYWMGEFGAVGSDTAVQEVLEHMPKTVYGMQYCFRTRKGLQHLTFKSALTPIASDRIVKRGQSAANRLTAVKLRSTVEDVMEQVPQDAANRLWMEGPAYLAEYIYRVEEK